MRRPRQRGRGAPRRVTPNSGLMEATPGAGSHHHLLGAKTRLTKEDRGQDHPPPDPRCRRAPGHQGRRANPPSGIDEPDATQSGVSDGGRQCQPDPPRWPSHNTGVTKAMPTQNRRRHVSGSTPIRDETAEASAAPRWAFRNRLAAKNGEPKEDYEGHQEGKECHRLREGKA